MFDKGAVLRIIAVPMHILVDFLLGKVYSNVSFGGA